MTTTATNPQKKTPHVLMILDGFGHRDNPQDNAIAAAKTPNYDTLLNTYPHGLISGSGLDVGLPEGQFGNSEVGHMNLGAGRVLYQDSTRVSKAIVDGDFFNQATLVNAVETAVTTGKAVHILGLLSDGGVHSHQDHIAAMCRLALQQAATQVYVHAFLDGRDTPPKSADIYLKRLQTQLDSLNNSGDYTGKVAIASVIGRYYAMDRDKRWDRVQQAYELLTQGKANRHVATALEAITLAYAAAETDEFVTATAIHPAEEQPISIQDGDSVIFMNFRADRAREITQALMLANFTGFKRVVRPKIANFVMLTKYSDELAQTDNIQTAYKPTTLINTLGEYLQNHGKTQLRIAETEKYAHVTFFFSGGREQEYTGETRILINSPDVATYDLKPEMSAYEVTQALEQAIDSGKYDVLVVNYANGDMVGHTGVFSAAVKAVETLDTCIQTIVDAVLRNQGHLLITADHGNVEQMQDYDSGQVHTQHTTESVPLIYVGNQVVTVREGGKLCDVAPTLLSLMGLAQPAEMTGSSLLIDS